MAEAIILQAIGIMHVIQTHKAYQSLSMNFLSAKRKQSHNTWIGKHVIEMNWMAM